MSPNSLVTSFLLHISTADSKQITLGISELIQALNPIIGRGWGALGARIMFKARLNPLTFLLFLNMPKDPIKQIKLVPKFTIFTKDFSASDILYTVWALTAQPPV